MNQGTVKFFDPEKDFGYITRTDNNVDYHFTSSQVAHDSGAIRGGSIVEFEGETIQGRPHATLVRSRHPLDRTVPLINFSGPKGSYLSQWAFVPLYDFTNDDGRNYRGVIKPLAKLALEEDWSFEGSDEFGILESYIKYTFLRLWNENKICVESEPVCKWAAFNTGLVDRTYSSIYALFRENDFGTRPWKFVDFCTPGIGIFGKKLTSVFLHLPERAEYFSNPSDVVLDARMDIDPQYDHIIEDGIERGRFPSSFLRSNLPIGFQWREPSSLTESERVEFLRSFSISVKSDDQCYRSIKARIDDAVRLARQRVSWNYKTAIPQYYPKHNQMSLLLPLSLTSDNTVDVALVVQRQPSGRYYASTVLPLSWAYKNARLVCRPDSDWLTTKITETSSEAD